MEWQVMTSLTELRCLPDKKERMVASVGFMAGETILCDRSVLPGKGTPLLSMAFEAEVVYRIGPDHLVRAKGSSGAESAHGLSAEPPHRVMTA
jgi:hypothetical protein